ncbi:hypothetical protein JJQ72_02790 [Paenibacillus sp. F411]|uniref:hypothetical protein n=1 Tax=Paenibacillus sp. F411 TaxID=2820239 RepID=UPI001AAE4CD4|nr:hypothetical protein [Paenibacillus sp. F411]MBO2942904.1 hypothetical protein [Paenibacillus sp. F411]
MHRKSISPQTNELEWLQASYDKKKNRSLENTIRKNQKLYNHFLQHRTTKVYKPRNRSSKPLDNDLDAFKHIKQDRDIDRVRQHYMQLTKPDLLIRMEQYIAYQNQHWLKNEFEKFINE